MILISLSDSIGYFNEVKFIVINTMIKISFVLLRDIMIGSLLSYFFIRFLSLMLFL